MFHTTANVSYQDNLVLLCRYYIYTVVLTASSFIIRLYIHIYIYIYITGRYNPVGPKDSQSLTLCLNSTKIVETLEDVMRKARAMYGAGAYLHWFTKHGCSKVTTGLKATHELAEKVNVPVFLDISRTVLSRMG